MTPVTISTIIVLVCLVLGAISVGIYIAVFKSRPENKGQDPNTSTIVLIMTTSLLLGLLVASGYFMWIGKDCPECYWGAGDVANLKGAQITFDTLQTKANRVPRNMSYTTSCDADATGGQCGVNTRKQSPSPFI